MLGATDQVRERRTRFGGFFLRDFGVCFGIGDGTTNGTMTASASSRSTTVSTTPLQEST